MIPVLPLMVLCIASSPQVEDLSCHFVVRMGIEQSVLTAYITESPYILRIEPTACAFNLPTGEILCHNYKTQPSYAMP